MGGPHGGMMLGGPHGGFHPGFHGGFHHGFHGGFRGAFGFGFPGFYGYPYYPYAYPVYYAPPPVYYAPPPAYYPAAYYAPRPVPSLPSSRRAPSPLRLLLRQSDARAVYLAPVRTGDESPGGRRCATESVDRSPATAWGRTLTGGCRFQRSPAGLRPGIAAAHHDD
jgi:hypothetical protein